MFSLAGPSKIHDRYRGPNCASTFPGCASPADFAGNLSALPPGTVTGIYVTSDGGASDEFVLTLHLPAKSIHFFSPGNRSPGKRATVSHTNQHPKVLAKSLHLLAPSEPQSETPFRQAPAVELTIEREKLGTSQAGLTQVYDMVSALEEHVEIVHHHDLIAAALQRG
jgi:hypothetical protein